MAAGDKHESGSEAAVSNFELQFCKEQIAASDRYRSQRDLVNALLERDKKYTIAAVDSLIETYRKGELIWL